MIQSNEPLTLTLLSAIARPHSSARLKNPQNPPRIADRTDGSLWLRREGKMWLLKTWPRTRNFTLELGVRRFGQPAKIECVGGSSASLTPTPAGSHWRLPLNGAREYRWANTTP